MHVSMHAKHIINNVVEIGASGHASKSLMHLWSRIVILLSLCRFTQHSIGFLDLLKPLSIATFVRMMLTGQFTKRTFNVILIGCTWHTKGGVIIFHLVIIAHLWYC